MSDERYERSADMRLLEMQREALGRPPRVFGTTQYTDPDTNTDPEPDDEIVSPHGTVLIAAIDAQPRSGLIAGALVTVSLAVNNDGDTAGREIRITLPLPTELAYRPGTLLVDGVAESDARAGELLGDGIDIGPLDAGARRTLVIKLAVETGRDDIILSPHLSASSGAILGLRAIRLRRGVASAPITRRVIERPFYESDDEEHAVEPLDERRPEAKITVLQPREMPPVTLTPTQASPVAAVPVQAPPVATPPAPTVAAAPAPTVAVTPPPTVAAAPVQAAIVADLPARAPTTRVERASKSKPKKAGTVKPSARIEKKPPAPAPVAATPAAVVPAPVAQASAAMTPAAVSPAPVTVAPAPVAPAPVAVAPAPVAPAPVAVASPAVASVRAKPAAKPRAKPKPKTKASAVAEAVDIAAAIPVRADLHAIPVATVATVTPASAPQARAATPEMTEAIEIVGQGGPILTVRLDRNRLATLSRLFAGQSFGMVAHYMVLNALAATDPLAGDRVDTSLATFVTSQEQLLSRALITTRLGKTIAPESVTATLPAFPPALTPHRDRVTIRPPSETGQALLIRAFSAGEVEFIARIVSGPGTPGFLQAAQLFVGLCANAAVVGDEQTAKRVRQALTAYAALATAEISRIYLRAKLSHKPQIFRATEPAFDDAARAVLDTLGRLVS